MSCDGRRCDWCWVALAGCAAAFAWGVIGGLIGMHVYAYCIFHRVFPQ